MMEIVKTLVEIIFTKKTFFVNLVTKSVYNVHHKVILLVLNVKKIKYYLINDVLIDVLFNFIKKTMNVYPVMFRAENA